jgi:hypothetical protein
MIDELISNLNSYIQIIVKCSRLNRLTAEQVINTQIAILFSDLAVKGTSECFLGEITYKDGKLHLEPNETIEGLLRGEVDPTTVLKEIFENV